MTKPQEMALMYFISQIQNIFATQIYPTSMLQRQQISFYKQKKNNIFEYFKFHVEKNTKPDISEVCTLLFNVY